MDHTSNLPWWDNPTMLVDVGRRLRGECRRANGWPPIAGPAPTSGDRTALHDHIAATPGLLADLERYGVEFPSALRDAAELLEAAQPTKHCCQCAKSKSVASFLPTKFSADGLADRCTPCVLSNAQRDRAEREARRAPTIAQGHHSAVAATRVAARAAKRRQRSNLTPSRNERTATHG